MARTFSNLSMHNLMEFSCSAEKFLLHQIEFISWECLPLLNKGIILKKRGMFYYQGNLYAIRVSHDFSETLKVVVTGISKSPQGTKLMAPLELGHFNQLKIELADDISDFPMEGLFQLIKALYIGGYAWLLASQEKAVTGNATTIAAQIYQALRKHTCNQEALDAIILCAVPQARSGNGIYLLDLERYRSSFRRIHACKHFTQQSTLHLMAQFMLHHVPYQKLCVRQSVESQQSRLISLSTAKYNDTKPHLVDAEIAFYRGVQEISVPILCNDNFYLVASFEANDNIHHEIKRMVQEARPEIERIVNNNISGLLKLEQLISRGAPQKPAEPLNFSSPPRSSGEWLTERYVLAWLEDKSAVGECLVTTLAGSFIAKNRDSTENGFQDGAREVSEQIYNLYGIRMKDETIQRFIDRSLQKGKRPNKATVNKMACWMLKKKLRPRETLTRLCNKDWITETEFQRLERTMNRFSFSRYDDEVNYADIVQRFTTTLEAHRDRLLDS